MVDDYSRQVHSQRSVDLYIELRMDIYKRGKKEGQRCQKKRERRREKEKVDRESKKPKQG